MELLIIILLANLALCAVVGWVSEKRGRGFAFGFWVSFFFSALIGLLVLLVLRDVTEENSKPASVVSVQSEPQEPPPVQNLDSAQYRLWLTRAYSITKNDVLGEFVCGDVAFQTADEALRHAHELEAQKVAKAEVEKLNPQAKMLEQAEALGVSFDGQLYAYKAYRYEKLEDAVAYATLEKSK